MPADWISPNCDWEIWLQSRVWLCIDYAPSDTLSASPSRPILARLQTGQIFSSISIVVTPEKVGDHGCLGISGPENAEFSKTFVLS